jgi:hypothetical protein|tara:strand:- start:210 stop:323 length:114 start_codon:yes stop_codon:yes gene_type:complete
LNKSATASERSKKIKAGESKERAAKRAELSESIKKIE